MSNYRQHTRRSSSKDFFIGAAAGTVLVTSAYGIITSVIGIITRAKLRKQANKLLTDEDIDDITNDVLKDILNNEDEDDKK